ncbi:phosphatase PAP2 family protein [Jiangella ureilytica]|uniref:Phosphatase PAP2 family protein n=1 Tax=Jiangella ureilytica TaxID=2530374 RepID=A0A4R4S3T4_9ACTN|nr:phosphatase PAP2 family protein [Jiangella ureilytica]TDC56674.1 phosphatase PAP2 family protein [Jiangella ureilytica]
MRAYSPRPGGVVLGLLVFVAGALGTWASWRWFVDTAVGQRIDQVAFRGSGIGRSTLWSGAEQVLDIVSVPFVVVVLGAAALIALLRQRWLLALQVIVLVGGANLTTQVLKRTVLDRPRLAEDTGPLGNSLPSGHTTVAASVAAALVLVVPRRARPAVAVVGAGYTALTGVSTMVGGWHRPSDVVAAITVVLAWAGLTTVLTAVSSPEKMPVLPVGTTPTAVVTGLFVVAGGVAGAMAASALLRTRDVLNTAGAVTERSDLATAYVGAALGVVAVTALAFAAILVAHQVASRAPSATGRISGRTTTAGVSGAAS